jgi:hypothetical protein
VARRARHSAQRLSGRTAHPARERARALPPVILYCALLLPVQGPNMAATVTGLWYRDRLSGGAIAYWRPHTEHQDHTGRRNLRPGSCALRFQPVDKLAHDEGSVVTAEAEAVAQRDSDG